MEKYTLEKRRISQSKAVIDSIKVFGKKAKSVAELYLLLNAKQWEEIIIYLTLAESKTVAQSEKDKLISVPLFRDDCRMTNGELIDTQCLIMSICDYKAVYRIARAAHRLAARALALKDYVFLTDLFNRFLDGKNNVPYLQNPSFLIEIVENENIPITLRRAVTQFMSNSVLTVPAPYFEEKAKVPELFMPCLWGLYKRKAYFKGLETLKFLPEWPKDKINHFLLEFKLKLIIIESSEASHSYSRKEEGATCGRTWYKGSVDFIIRRLIFDVKPDIKSQLLAIIKKDAVEGEFFNMCRMVHTRKIAVNSDLQQAIELLG